jgi:hypothetical protein
MPRMLRSSMGMVSPVMVSIVRQARRSSDPLRSTALIHLERAHQSGQLHMAREIHSCLNV